MPTAAYAAIMLAAGVGIPILAALNAALGRHMGSPAGAAVVLFCVALACALTASLVLASDTPLRSGLARVAQAPRHLLLGGILIAFYVIAITAIAPRFGVGNAVFFVLLGQLIAAALIDHFGLFGAPQSPLTMRRAGGILLMAVGVALTQSGGSNAGP